MSGLALCGEVKRAGVALALIAAATYTATVVEAGTVANAKDNSLPVDDNAPPVSDGGRFELLVLGIAQDGGVPHLGCRRECCVEARRDGRRLFPASIAVVDRVTGARLLVEATPAIEPQLTLLDSLAGPPAAGGVGLDAVLLTHAHIGHYIGLAQFGREVASTRGLPVFGTARMAAFLAANGPWSQLVELGQIGPRVVEYGRPFEPIPGLEVTAIRVPHREEFTDAVAWRLRDKAPKGLTVLFAPDVDRWDREEGLLARLLEGADVAYLDATFYDGRELPERNLAEIPHPPMVDTMRRLAARAARAPGAFRFIHFNHTNPVLRDAALRAECEARGFGMAEQGERRAF